jgi:hemoglobin-like flavoprotein
MPIALVCTIAKGDAMTPRQIDLVQSSFRSILVISATTAQLFYKRLSELDPAVAPMFSEGQHDQGRKFMNTLGAAVAWLKRLESVTPALEALAQRHANYGVRAHHYDVAREALLWALRQGLGEDFEGELEEAWIAMYGEVAAVMMRATRARAPIGAQA